MSGFSVISHMNIDFIYSGLPGNPGLGEEVYSKRFDLQLGGGPVVIAVRLSGMGIPTKLGTFLSGDIIGRLCRELLSDLGYTDYENLYTGSGQPVMISSVLSFNEDRSFISYSEGVSDAGLSDDAVYDFLKGSKICFAPNSEEVLKRLKRDGTTIVYDTGWHEGKRIGDIAHILRHCDVFSPNDKEAMHLTETNSVADALRVLGELVRCPIIKSGKDGCIGLVNQSPVHVPAIDHFVAVDKTGAGDNFLSGIVYGLYNGWDMVRCMQMANVMGGHSTTELGCFKADITAQQANDFMRFYKE